MTLFDDTPHDSNEQPPPEQDASLPAASESPSLDIPGPQLAGDPISYAASAPPSYVPRRPALPEDLRISWSWPHFFVFIFFTASSFFLVQTVLILYFAPHRSLPPKELERYLLNKPQFLFGTNFAVSRSGRLSAGKNSKLISPPAKQIPGLIFSPAAAWLFSFSSPARRSIPTTKCPSKKS